jgi:DNA repair exonuclease SbcCD ATPase subunit
MADLHDTNDDDDDSGSGTKTRAAHIQADIVNIEKALIGTADLEEGILKQVQIQLDKMLGSIYERVKDLKHIAAKEILISEKTITDADRAAMAQGLSDIADGLNQKNAEIVKLEHELSLLGVATDALTGGMSLEALQQKVNDLNRRNRELRKIHAEMFMLTERIPKATTLQSVQEMARTLNKTLDTLSKANLELKQQIKQQQTAEKSAENKLDDTSKPRFKRGG